MRRTPLSIAITLIALAIVAVAGAIVLRPPADLATPAPSPSPPPATTPSQATSPRPSPSAIPSPTPQGQYVSKRGGFALTLPPPWRRASCGNSDPGTDRLAIGESFTSAAVMEEHIGHAGSANDRVAVQVSNAEGLTPTQFAERVYPGSPLASVTFAGRPAVEVRPPTGGEDGLFYYMADGDRMYSVGYRPMTSGPPDTATMLGILRSFRFLSTAERAALPELTPIPAAAPTAQALAGMLKTALEQKDVAALERLLGPCVSQGVRPGGGAAEPRERFVAELRQQFAAGLTVTVDASVSTETTGSSYDFVGSRWNAFPPGGGAPPASPQPQPLNVQLLIGRTQAGFYWSGTLVVHTF